MRYRQWVCMSFAAVLACVTTIGGCLYSMESDSEETVRVGIGMHPSEVAAGSTYPIPFARDPGRDGGRFEYNSPIVTADVRFCIIENEEVCLEDVRYWNIITEFSEVVGVVARRYIGNPCDKKAYIDQVIQKIEDLGWSRANLNRYGYHEDVFAYRATTTRARTLKMHSWGEMCQVLRSVEGEEIKGITVHEWEPPLGGRILALSLLRDPRDLNTNIGPTVDYEALDGEEGPLFLLSVSLERTSEE